MSLNELALTEAVITALGKKVGDKLKGIRTKMQETLEETDIEKLGIRLPDGTRVASISATNPEPTPTITDETAFLDWVAEHSPDNYVERTVTVREVRPAYLTAITAEMTKRKAAEIVGEGGEIVEVPGILLKERTRSHTVRWEDGELSTAAVEAAWASGDLNHLEGLRALTPGGGEQ